MGHPSNSNGEPESADATIRLFNAARSFGVPWLGVDHVTKNAGTKNRPFGSTYTYNLARMTWGVEKAQEEGESRLTVVLTNYKANAGRLSRRRGYHIDFEEDEFGRPMVITFTACDVRDVPALTPKLGQKDQLISVLKANNAALRVEDIQTLLEAEDIVMSEGAIRAVLSRYKDTFVSRRDGQHVVWGILSKVYSNA